VNNTIEEKTHTHIHAPVDNETIVSLQTLLHIINTINYLEQATTENKHIISSYCMLLQQLEMQKPLIQLNRYLSIQ
jgi:hypothetical protein